MGRQLVFLLVGWTITLLALLAVIFLLREAKVEHDKALQVVPIQKTFPTTSGFTVPPPPF